MMKKNSNLDENHNNYEEDIHPHCLNCINLNKCSWHANCNLIKCPNGCEARFHRCKLREHLSETCPFTLIDCLNKSNGCLMQVRRDRCGEHLRSCVASVVRCGSYTVRKLMNRNEQFKHLKWPDPIESERSYMNYLTKEQQQQQSKEVAVENINESLLREDCASLRKFAQLYPLKFHRMYGHIIGLNVAQDYSQSRFSFMRHLLKNVKSKIFTDIQTENCILFNDEEGCSACQTRIKKLEMERFKQLKEDTAHFFYVLKNANDYREFVESRIYLNYEFIKAYQTHFLMNNNTAVVSDDDSASNNQQQLTSEELASISEELLKNNQEILELIELNPVLQLNVAQEMPCEAFQMQYESYRIKDTNFACDCDMILRRDEFADHYALFHNFLLPYADQIDQMCPYREYGCRFFQSKYDFIFGREELNRYLNLEHPSAVLIHNDISNSLAFSLDLNNDIQKGDDYSYSSIRSSASSSSSCKSFLDLPYEVMFDIIDRLDSLSLYSLSITSKTRGICCTKWVKITQSASESKPSNIVIWKLDRHVYSFSKHIENPTKIKLKVNNKNSKNKNYNSSKSSVDESNRFIMHVQTCPFRRIREHTEPFRIYPRPHLIVPNK